MDNVDVKLAMIGLGKTLLRLNPATERALITRLTSAPAHLVLNQVANPKATLIYNSDERVCRTYCFELTIGGMTIGLSLMTNYDNAKDPTKRFVEFVPVYVLRGTRVDWWAFQNDELVMGLLINQINTLTLTLDQ